MTQKDEALDSAENQYAPYSQPPTMQHFFLIVKVSTCGDDRGFYIKSENTPGRVHLSKKEAHLEASRLAALNPCEKFVILESQEYVMSSVVVDTYSL